MLIKFSQLVNHYATKEGIAVLQHGFINNYFRTLRLNTLHNVLNQALTETTLLNYYDLLLRFTDLIFNPIHIQNEKFVHKDPETNKAGIELNKKINFNNSIYSSFFISKLLNTKVKMTSKIVDPNITPN